MAELILGLITVGAKLFASERKRYFEMEAKKLQEEIYKVEESDFYNKDMDAKGKAEREIERRSGALAQEFIKEGNK